MAIERLSGIVTDIIRHNDRHNIVTLFTRERGRVSFLVPAGGGRTGRSRNARLQLLAAIECEVNFKESRSVQSLTNVALKELWRDIYFNPVKGALVMFIAEFLSKYLREAYPEPLLWDYVVDSIRTLDRRKSRCANFHISFLIGALHFAGIYPDASNFERGDYFDMALGHYVADRPSHSSFLPPSEAEMLPMILRMNCYNDRWYKFKVGERRRIVSRILQYYAVHFPGMNSFRSLDVLAEVFA